MDDYLGLRKGAWTKEEDDLLRQCVQKHGEGQWHQVPLRAGLNRCRKSCRMRWLNYLKPDIKRGEFTEDEQDLILRLHKLLGNRWALIAGRLPGRTANDVKNYWNTRVQINYRMKKMKDKPHQNKKTVVIRPQPHSFFKISSSFSGKEPTSEKIRYEENSSTLLQTSPSTASGNDWWASLLEDNDNVGTTTFYCPWFEEEIFTSLWFDGTQHSARTCVIFGEEEPSKSDFSFNVDLWSHSKE